MKTALAIVGLILSFLDGASSGSAQPVAPSLQVTSTPDSAENAGNLLNVPFTASGIPAGESAEVWFVDAATHTTVTELVAIDIPVRNGANIASFNIPFSWSQPGKYRVKVVVTILDKHGLIAKQVIGMSSSTIRVRSAVIRPYGGTTLNQGHGTWVTWSTESVNRAQFFKVSVSNESTGFRQLVGDRVDPSAGRYFFTVPHVTGSGFRIVLKGYVLIEEDDYYFEDTVESTQSEKLTIR